MSNIKTAHKMLEALKSQLEHATMQQTSAINKNIYIYFIAYVSTYILLYGTLMSAANASIYLMLPAD